MTQTILTYLLVALAAAWLVWSMFVPKRIRQSLRARVSAPKTAAAGGKGGCDCGGSCHD